MKKLAYSERSLLRSWWPLLFSIFLAAALASYLALFRDVEIFARSMPGMIYGAIMLVAIIFLFSLSIRKSIYNRKLGSTQGWLQAHIYVGIICIVLIFLHMGFRFTGYFSNLLYILFSLVIISGIAGVLIYSTIPLSLSKFGRDIPTTLEIRTKIEELLSDADVSIESSTEEFKDIYTARIRPLFKTSSPQWSYLFKEERQIENASKKTFSELKKEVAEISHYDLKILASIHTKIERLSFKWSKLRILRAWLNVHVPISVAFGTAVVLHLIVIFYY